MKRISDINRWLYIVVVTLVVWAQGYVQSIFHKLNARNLYLLGVVFLAIVGIQLVNWLTTHIIERFQFLRMIIAGRDDIEGDWVEVIVSTTDTKDIIATEYSRIRYHKGEYVLSGDTWTLDGKWVEDFYTEGSNYQNREFEYYYKTGINRVGGFGVILFSPSDGLPTDFICRYVDENLPAPCVARGRRVARRLKKVSQDERRAAALKFAGQFENLGLLNLEAFIRHPRLLVPQDALANLYTRPPGSVVHSEGVTRRLDHRRSKQSGLTGDTDLASESGVAGDDLPVVKSSRDTRDDRRKRGPGARAADHGRQGGHFPRTGERTGK